MDPNAVLRSYANEEDVPALMGKAIAYNRLGRGAERDSMLGQLNQKDPNNPYNWDLEAELYYTSGDIKRACTIYDKAHKALTDNPIIALGQAKCLTQGNAERKKAAIALLTRFEPNLHDLVTYWTLLARTYDEVGNRGRAEAVTAELRYRQGKKEDALWFAKRANQSLLPGDPWHARMQDIISSLDRG
jgi:Putative Zn-dependent protease, contains TPR repeats